MAMLAGAEFRHQGFRPQYPQGYKFTSQMIAREKAPKVVYYFETGEIPRYEKEEPARFGGYDYGQAVEEFLMELPAPPALVAYRDWLHLTHGVKHNHFIAIRNHDGKQTFAPCHQDKAGEWADGDDGFTNLSLCEGDADNRCPRLFEFTSSKNDKRGVDVVWGEHLAHGSILRVSAEANRKFFHRVLKRPAGEQDGVRYSIVGRTMASMVFPYGGSISTNKRELSWSGFRDVGEERQVEYLATDPATFGYPTTPLTMVVEKKDGTYYYVADKVSRCTDVSRGDVRLILVRVCARPTSARER
jgi:hypothetical protein